MNLYICGVSDTLPRIIRRTLAASSYTSVALYRSAIIALNATDDGTAPVIRDWTWLPSQTIVRLPS